MTYFVNVLNHQNRPLPVSGAPQHWLSASAKGQTIIGTSGNDAIYGAGGDTLVGGGGDDTFYVSSSDKVVVAPGGGIDTIVTYWGSYVLPDNVQNLVIQGDGAYGGGNALDNLITAVGAGEHTLNGGGGNNVLTGGTGKDIFVHDKGNSNDVITNFQPGIDQVRLDNYSFFTFDAVHSAMQQVGGDVVLTLGTNDSLTFRNVQVSQLSAHDFMVPIDYSKLHATFGDEFNTLSLHNGNSGTWDTSFPWAGQTGASLTGEQEWYINAAYAPTSSVKPWCVSNGILDLTAAPATPSIQQSIGNHEFTSGMLTTAGTFAQTYGYFEMRAELPSGKGLAPAFWLLPQDGSWPPELDVMEVVGSNPTALVMGVHSNSTGHPTAVGDTARVADTTAGFHTYGVDWEPNTITWYFDGNEVLQVATPADMHKAMYMVVNLAVGGSWAGSPNSSTSFPATMQIDYVRAYATTAAPPVISTFSPDTNIVGDGVTSANKLTLTGSSEAFSTVNIFDGTTLIGMATANGVGAWTFATGLLTDGSHKFTATDTNAAGNTSAASSTFVVTVDTKGPNAPVIQQSSASLSTITLNGLAEANSAVTVFDGTTKLGIVTASGKGTWTLKTGAMTFGAHAFTASATDAAGNTSAMSSPYDQAMSTITKTSNPVSASSVLSIASGAALELTSAYSGILSFAAATGTLRIDNSSSFSGKIAGQLAIGDVIDLADVTAGANATIRYSGNKSPGTLTVTDGTHTASIALLGNFSLANFTAFSDGHGGTSVVDPPLPASQGGNAAADSSAMDQQMTLLSQYIASAFSPPAFGSDSPSVGKSEWGGGQLSNLAQPVTNRQHA